jgi:LPXTG-site transpeptidase (sortase) family protein
VKRAFFVLLVAVGAAPVVVAGLIAVLVALDLPSKEEENPSLADARPATAAATATAVATAIAPDGAPPAATAEAGSGPSGVDVARLLVPSIEIDAPIVTLGVDADGTMQSPDNPVDVAWYSFSGRPGEGSNIVMAGHLDFVNYGAAVFYRLKEAKAGDELQLALVDGSTALYRILDVAIYDEATAPVLEIVGPTESEIVTLITCGGSFDPVSREYDKRVVLRAERVPEQAQAAN